MFKLDPFFVAEYAGREPDWGFKSGPNSIGEITFFRTYSRQKPDGTKERWHETVARVVEGIYRIQEEHALTNSRPWSDSKAQRSAQEMFDRIFSMKFLPPGRGLWMAGTEYVESRKNGAPLNNCAFVSTKDDEDPSKPFRFLMDMSMLGVGVGFDTRGKGRPVYQPTNGGFAYLIPDSREGWVESVGLLLDSYLLPDRPAVVFAYDDIRPAGEPIKGFGGVAEGPGPLIKLHERIRQVLCCTTVLTSRIITDIMNMIGACVVAGNVRRSAELALGDPNDSEFLDLKNYELNPDRAEWAWASNNSVAAYRGMDYSRIAKRIADNGEPGLVYLDNIQQYGRMNGEIDTADSLAIGTNPCAEQPLESYELCTLVEVFPTNHDSKEDFLRTLKFAYLYGKSVTLLQTHWPETNEVMQRNRRIGTSISGVVQFLHQRSETELIDWTESGYDYITTLDYTYSGWLGVPLSKRRTTNKPSGSVSLLAGVTPGAHYPTFDTGIRRIRLAAGQPLADLLRAAGYHVEPDLYSDNTLVVEMPVRGVGVPIESEVSIKEKARVATLMARHWADNAVSVTVTFREDEKHLIEEVLRDNEDKWKTVSMLPLLEGGAFKQMPYEATSEEEYERRIAGLQRVDFSEFYGVAEGELYCTTDKCELTFA